MGEALVALFGLGWIAFGIAFIVALARKSPTKWWWLWFSAGCFVVAGVLASASWSDLPGEDRSKPAAQPKSSAPTPSVALSDSDTSPSPRPRPEGAQTAVSTDSVEYKLACIDAGQRLAVSDPQVAVFSRLVDSIEKKVINNRTQVGDSSVRAWQLANKAGHGVTLLETAQSLDASIPSEAASLQLKYDEICAAWLTLLDAQKGKAP